MTGIGRRRTTCLGPIEQFVPVPQPSQWSAVRRPVTPLHGIWRCRRCRQRECHLDVNDVIDDATHPGGGDTVVELGLHPRVTHLERKKPDADEKQRAQHCAQHRVICPELRQHAQGPVGEQHGQQPAPTSNRKDKEPAPVHTTKMDSAYQQEDGARSSERRDQLDDVHAGASNRTSTAHISCPLPGVWTVTGSNDHVREAIQNAQRYTLPSRGTESAMSIRHSAMCPVPAKRRSTRSAGVSTPSGLGLRRPCEAAPPWE